MGEAVAALDAAEMARANDLAGGAEIGRHRLARGIVDEMDVAAELPCRDGLAEHNGEFEEPGIGRQHEIVAPAHLDEPHRLARRRIGLALDDSGIGEQVADTALDYSDAERVGET